MSNTPNRFPRLLFLALAVSTALAVQTGMAFAQANTNSAESDGLNPSGTSSANGGLLAQVDTNGTGGLRPSTNSSVVVQDNLNAQARSNTVVRNNAIRNNTTTRVGDSSARVGDDASAGRNRVGVGSTSDVNSSFNDNLNGSLNNGSVGVNNSTGAGLNATVGGATAGSTNTSVNSGARVGVGATNTGSSNAGTTSSSGVTR